MSIPMGLPPDLIDLLSAFADERVEYLLAFGRALAIHGKPRFTKAVVTGEELIRLERASGRPQDLVDANGLERA